MQNITKMADRLTSYGKATRTGEIGIQHQTVFIRTAALDDDDLVDNNYSGFSGGRLLDVMRTEPFKAMVDRIGQCFEDNVANTDDQFFPVQNFNSPYETFCQEEIKSLPALTEVRIEIRQAQVFSQNVYYFVKNKKDVSEFEDQFRQMLAENDLPAETVNLIFTVPNSVTLAQMYELMTIFSIVLRETAKDAMFVPGRVIGNFNQITKGKCYAF
ncbi:hypothetical protein MOC16_gp061 [Klebsiella phage vB_KpM_FBKp24]|uniref:Uncharacterized protein n=1 Tax=Klebsiella phage vB_KpM_FBKp24 TaxID=2801834 RepID=A0A7U0GBI4_9CAUD|nr:hypothetical protein [Klebsiella pneumoniae]YP_010298989.1 hypothetical protein MOC16_gp061 [Klebsiella phage vB_KpM_FBKp24]QQV92122.1 hypothetical protein vBKpMFBKp24_352 [Klebsiella phage vB_KpM_FBKp24]